MESKSLPETYLALTAKTGDQEAKLQTLPLPKPAKNQVLVKVAFATLQPSDSFFLSGYLHQYPNYIRGEITLEELFNPSKFKVEPPVLVGREASGTVVAVGENLERPFKIGDRVHVHSLGALAEYVVAYTDDVAPILGDLSFEEAAYHMTNPGLVGVMELLAERGGHKAAINTAASSNLGKMWIKYFKEKGIKTINIVRNDKWIEELKKEGADYVLNSEAPDFEQKLKEIAEKEQAKIAFDCIGPLSKTLLKNMPANSVCYQYGLIKGGEVSSLLTTTELEDGKKLKGLLYFPHLQDLKKEKKIEEFYHDIHSRMKTVFKTEVKKIYPLKDVLEAYANFDKTQEKTLIQAS